MGLSSAWNDALALLEDDLRRRDAAARTRRAYGVDLSQFAHWATARGLEPKDVGPRDVRRYVALLSEQNAAAEHDRAQAGGAARLLRQPARARPDRSEPGRPRLHAAALVLPAARAQGARRSRACSTRSDRAIRVGLRAAGADGPLILRDRALFELAYSCGLRAEELVSLRVADVDHDGEQLRVEGKGRKTRYLPVGEVAMAAVRIYLERGRNGLTSPSESGASRGKRRRRCS